MIGIDHLASAAMARSVYYAAMSLDGYIADLDENLEWLTGFDGPGYAGDAEHRGPMESSYPAFMEGIGALVMGSKTYEFILGQSWVYGDLPVWVLTSRELPAVEEASGLRFASGPVTAIHDEAMEAATGKDLWVVGGGNVATQYLEAGLLDVVQVTIVPVVLGDGLPLRRAGPAAEADRRDALRERDGGADLRGRDVSDQACAAATAATASRSKSRSPRGMSSSSGSSLKVGSRPASRSAIARLQNGSCSRL